VTDAAVSFLSEGLALAGLVGLPEDLHPRWEGCDHAALIAQNMLAHRCAIDGLKKGAT